MHGDVLRRGCTSIYAEFHFSMVTCYLLGMHQSGLAITAAWRLHRLQSIECISCVMMIDNASTKQSTLLQLSPANSRVGLAV